MKKFTILLFAVLAAPLAGAVELTGGDYQGRDDVGAFVKRMVDETAYTERELVELFSSVTRQERAGAGGSGSSASSPGHAASSRDRTSSERFIERET